MELKGRYQVNHIIIVLTRFDNVFRAPKNQIFTFVSNVDIICQCCHKVTSKR